MINRVYELYDQGGVIEVARGLERFAHWRWKTQLNNLHKHIVMRRLGGGCHIFEEDWDNLLVLDACRPDMFDRICWLDGKLETRISLGPKTPRWMEQNFNGRNLSDTVYVTANPQYELNDVDTDFAALYPVWRDAWDDENETILPKDVVEYTREAAEEYPNKRLLVHFMQPHYPFIGDLGQELSEHSGLEASRLGAQGEEARRYAPTIWKQLEADEVNKDEVQRAYDENLRLVLEEIEMLVNELDGKTVLTSDHGNLLGERAFRVERWLPRLSRRYGHPEVYSKALLEVPWFEVPCDKRKEIIRGVEGRQEAVADEVVKDRLESLGYQ